ncbi:unnamed protein product [Brachionus calyciflorus]|uniref:G-protein coupled receptors family 1 profile domain-containing protein n=1 Tax=Brachionus calyciflorus TaxID=104777 RepID=A0A813YLY8_9BILA|nr:unnamed protein product [Brachionus calyciflorus]
MFNASLNGFAVVDPFDVESPVSCGKLRILATYCVFIFIGSVLANTSLLWTLIYYKDLRNSVNAFMIALSSCNLLGSLIEMPLVIVSNFNCKWYFKKAGCVFGAFIMYSIGCISIFLLTAISFERFYIIYKPMSIKSINQKLSLIIISACVFFGVLWALFPVFGWSHYSLEGAMTSCSVEWNERSFNVVSYNIAIFAFVYFLPLIAIAYSNLRLIFMTFRSNRLDLDHSAMRSLNQNLKKFKDPKNITYGKKGIRNMPKFANGSDGNLDKKMLKKLKVERELTVSTLILIAGFMITWTPYALVSMYSAFIDHGKMDPLTATIPSMFAKGSLIWSSGIYIYTNKQVKKKFKRLFMNIEEPTSFSMIKSYSMENPQSKNESQISKVDT